MSRVRRIFAKHVSVVAKFVSTFNANRSRQMSRFHERKGGLQQKKKPIIQPISFLLKIDASSELSSQEVALQVLSPL